MTWELKNCQSCHMFLQGIIWSYTIEVLPVPTIVLLVIKIASPLTKIKQLSQT